MRFHIQEYQCTLNIILKVNVENLKKILNIIRKVTKTIKVFPFIYAVILIIVIPLVSFVDYDIAIIINDTTFLSPLVIAFLILLSYSLKLCFWHRLQCSLPLIPQISDFIDTHITEYGEALATLNFIILLLLFILSLVNAYFVFIRPARNS